MSPHEPIPRALNANIDIARNSDAATVKPAVRIHSPDLRFESILNFRDVGSYVNQLCGTRYGKDSSL